jgi:hypothetical protein
MLIQNTVCSFPYPKHQSATSLEDLFGQVLLSGLLTPIDRLRIRAVLLNDSISEEHHAIINRLLYGVRRGFIKLVF